MIAGEHSKNFNVFYKRDYFRLVGIPTYYLQALLPIALDFTTKIWLLKCNLASFNDQKSDTNFPNPFYLNKNQQKYETFLLTPGVAQKKTTRPTKKYFPS